MLSNKQWGTLANYCRSRLASLLDPGMPFAEQGDLHASMNILHKGFYIGAIDPEGDEICRTGFLKESQNVCDSADMVVANFHRELKAKGVSPSKVHTSSFHFTLITDVRYISDPLAWDEEKDGVYFMWGQDYRGLYLPYQIKRMGIPKVKVLDRLCTWECGVCSNLWRLSGSMCYRISCSSYSA